MIAVAQVLNTPRGTLLKRISLGIALGLVVLAQPAFAAVNAVASLASPLDNAGASARATAMGSAFVGLADDTSALFWNAAGLGGLRSMQVALHHNSWLGGIVQETAVLGLPLGSLGGMAASVNYVNYGLFQGYDKNGSKTDNYSANRYGFDVGWGMEVMPNLAAGAALKGALQSIGGSNYADAALDLGVLWAPRKHLRLGLAYTNLGTSIAGKSLASDISAGASYLLNFAATNQLLLSASTTFEPGGINKIQFGGEDTIDHFLALRLGYQMRLADTQIQDLVGLTAGLGAKLDSWTLDYAFLPFGDLGSTHRLSLTYEFGRPHKAS